MTAKDGKDLSTQIAQAIRDNIIAGDLVVGERLPSEADLTQTYGVSRPTVREALKQLVAQNLIRTQRGAKGGAFVNRLTFETALEQQVIADALLIRMNDIDFAQASQARFAFEQSCLRCLAQSCPPEVLASLRAEVLLQSLPDTEAAEFWASDHRFHLAIAKATNNPVLQLHLIALIEVTAGDTARLPLPAEAKTALTEAHEEIADALEDNDADTAIQILLSIVPVVLNLWRSSSHVIDHHQPEDREENKHTDEQ